MENWTQLSDQQLVELYVNGNCEAFDALLERHQSQLFCYTLSLVNGDNDRANDIFQDTFVKAIMALRSGQYAETGQFSAWLKRIAHNVVLDKARRKKTRKETPHEITNEDGEVCGDLLNKADLCDSNVEYRIFQEQRESNVRRMVEQLPEEQRRVVKMRYYDELSFKEIAALTGVSINTALGRMHYGLKNLRRMVARQAL